MAQQTAYNNNPAPSVAGMVNHVEGEIIWTKVASGSVGIGLLCSPGSASLSIPAPLISTAASGEAGTIIAYPSGHTDNPVLDLYAMGIPIWDPNYGVYLDKQTVPFLRKGTIWVVADAATTQFAPAYVYTTAETNQPIGTWGAGSGTGKSAFSRAIWLMTTTAAGLSLLEIW
jgi:hypothetical protein